MTLLSVENFALCFASLQVSSCVPSPPLRIPLLLHSIMLPYDPFATPSISPLHPRPCSHLHAGQQMHHRRLCVGYARAFRKPDHDQQMLCQCSLSLLMSQFYFSDVMSQSQNCVQKSPLSRTSHSASAWFFSISAWCSVMYRAPYKPPS